LTLTQNDTFIDNVLASLADLGTSALSSARDAALMGPWLRYQRDDAHQAVPRLTKG